MRKLTFGTMLTATLLVIACGSTSSRGVYKDLWNDPAAYSSRANPMVRSGSDNDSMYTPQYGFCGPRDLTTFSCQ